MLSYLFILFDALDRAANKFERTINRVQRFKAMLSPKLIWFKREYNRRAPVCLRIPKNKRKRNRGKQ